MLLLIVLDWRFFSAEEENAEEYGDNWDVVDIGGQSIGIKTSSIEQTAEAFQLLVVYASRPFLLLFLFHGVSIHFGVFFLSFRLGLGAHFAPYMEETMNLSLKNLTFFFEDSVRESAAMCVPFPTCFFSYPTPNEGLILGVPVHRQDHPDLDVDCKGGWGDHSSAVGDRIPKVDGLHCE